MTDPTIEDLDASFKDVQPPPLDIVHVRERAAALSRRRRLNRAAPLALAAVVLTLSLATVGGLVGDRGTPVALGVDTTADSAAVPVRAIAFGVDGGVSLTNFNADPPLSQSLDVDGDVEGAAFVPGGGLLLWDDTVRFIDDTQSVTEIPSATRDSPSYATEVRALPSPTGASVWVVTAGVGYGPERTPAIVELVDLRTFQALARVEVPAPALPIGVTDAGLVLNTESFEEADDGTQTTVRGSQYVLLIDDDGQQRRVAEGKAISAGGSVIAVTGCPTPGCTTTSHLRIVDPWGSQIGSLEAEVGHEWAGVGSAPLPGSTVPLATVSPDHTFVLAALAPVSGGPSHLVVVDVESGETQDLLTPPALIMPATWSEDGRVIVFNGRDARVLSLTAPEEAGHIPNALPPDHFVVATGQVSR